MAGGFLKPQYQPAKAKTFRQLWALTVCLPPFAKNAKDGAPPIKLRRRKSNYRKGENLLQAFDQVEVAQGAMEAVHVGFSVGRGLDRSDGGDASSIDRNNLLADSFLSRS